MGEFRWLAFGRRDGHGFCKWLLVMVSEVKLICIYPLLAILLDVHIIQDFDYVAFP